MSVSRNNMDYEELKHECERLRQEIIKIEGIAWRDAAVIKYLKQEIDFLKRADRFTTWNDKAQKWEKHFSEPLIKENESPKI